MVSLWVKGLLGTSLLSAAAHPMHTSVTQVIQEAEGRSLRIELRLFADDLKQAIEADPDDARAESLIAVYIQQRLVLYDRMGAPVALRWDGADLVGDVVLVRLGAAPPSSLSGVRIANSVLCERFRDQVNVVRAAYDGRSATLIFTPGDPAKPLP